MHLNAIYNYIIISIRSICILYARVHYIVINYIFDTMYRHIRIFRSHHKVRSRLVLHLAFLSHAALFWEVLRESVLKVAMLSYGEPRSVIFIGSWLMEATALLAAVSLNQFLQAQEVDLMLRASVARRRLIEC